MIYRIDHDNEVLAIIISHKFSTPASTFLHRRLFRSNWAIRHPAGKMIEPHVHNAVAREVYYTQEVLINRGKLRVDFYDKGNKFLESHILETGDTVLLAAGGHGFEVLEEVEMIEVKQGPFSGDIDKTRFIPVTTPEQS